MRLENKVSIVTGAASGIGRAICREFAGEGACVAVADLDRAGAQQVAAEINAAGGDAIAVPTDITDGGAVRAMASAVHDRYGRIDILVNNAGRRIIGNFLDVSEADWREMLDVNLTGHFLCCKAVVPHMVAAGKGKIVNMASIAAIVGRPNRVGYCAAKGGLLAFTRALAADLAAHNICVNALNPGLIETAMNACFAENAAVAPQWASENLAGRWGQPADVARAALFLASDESDFITGESLNIDGGSVAAKMRTGESTPPS